MTDVHILWWKADGVDAPARGYWDQGLIELATHGHLWHQQDGYRFVHHDVEGVPQAVGLEGGVLIVNGRNHVGRIDELNAALATLPWSLCIVTSDEESLLDTDLIEADRVWGMTPTPGRFLPDVTLGEGFRDDTPGLMPAVPEVRAFDVAFAGQVTHSRRRQALKAMDALEGLDVSILPTEGFTQGMPRHDYLRLMASTKVAPCPGGPATPDSFRLYEALEAHAVPVADQYPAAHGYPTGYWDLVLPGHPFPVIDDWAELPKYVDAILSDWPASSNRVAAWWVACKRRGVQMLHDDITMVSKLPRPEPTDPSALITVVVPTSPIPSHPSIDIIDQVVRSVRTQLPSAEVIVAADGVRDEQAHMKPAYDEYIRRLLWAADHDWGNTLVLLNDEHRHQAGITRAALDHVRTPLLLFVEHDTPVFPEPIPWAELCTAVRSGRANLVRFHHEAHVLDVHRHMMLDDRPADVEGAPLLRTVQWSQRPHLASVGFYRTLLDTYFPPTSRTMIEDKMHGVVHEAFRRHGLAGWEQFRLWMFAPAGDIKRSGHLDGREGEPKFDMVYR